MKMMEIQKLNKQKLSYTSAKDRPSTAHKPHYSQKIIRN